MGLSLRINKKLRDDFSEFCKGAGIKISTAVNLLARECIKSGEIPFHIESQSNYVIGDEIIITSINIDNDTKKKFSEACDMIGVPMGNLIRLYMMKCLDEGKIPF